MEEGQAKTGIGKPAPLPALGALAGPGGWGPDLPCLNHKCTGWKTEEGRNQLRTKPSDSQSCLSGGLVALLGDELPTTKSMQGELRQPTGRAHFERLFSFRSDLF